MCLLLYTIRGCGWLEYQGQQVTIPENCLAVIDCRNYQHYRTYGQEWEFYWIHFDGKCAVDLVSLLNGNGLTVAQAGRIWIFPDGCRNCSVSASLGIETGNCTFPS